jgi:hypothetical protein
MTRLETWRDLKIRIRVYGKLCWCVFRTIMDGRNKVSICIRKDGADGITIIEPSNEDGTQQITYKSLHKIEGRDDWLYAWATKEIRKRGCWFPEHHVVEEWFEAAPRTIGKRRFDPKPSKQPLSAQVDAILAQSDFPGGNRAT